MATTFFINPGASVTKIRQIVNGVQMDLENGHLALNEKLPSINDFSKSLGVARDTVEKAYMELRNLGLITTIPGKGVYTAALKPSAIKVLLIINKMSSYKKEIYEGFLDHLGPQVIVDIQIHHYSPELLGHIIKRTKNLYQFYAIMPHFYSNADPQSYLPLLDSIHQDKLLIIDKKVPLQRKYRCVYQDFKNDIFEALESNESFLSKYNSVEVLFPEQSHHPKEIIEGVGKFSYRNNKQFRLLSGLGDVELVKGRLFITLTESELAGLIKLIRHSRLKIGKDVGIISFNETVLKELLDITVITTDFRNMGRMAAQLLHIKDIKMVRNRFYFIKRGSI